ncbi:hypothetical protein HY382_00850 [Candidatus Curtissbacteria bacterium]|nr:hypothetical protein [Candidatus Curtissbacteria bacterium]
MAKLLEAEREGVRVSRYGVPQETLTINRLTMGDREMRVDFNLTRKEKLHAPRYVREVFRTLGADSEDNISVAFVFEDPENQEQISKHFGLVIAPDHHLENRVGIALTSNINLSPFAMGNFMSDGKYEAVCEEFAVGMSGLHDTRILEILCEAGEWLPKVIEARRVIDC